MSPQGITTVTVAEPVVSAAGIQAAVVAPAAYTTSLAALAVATPGGNPQPSRAVVSIGGCAESVPVSVAQVIVIAYPGEDPQPCRAVVASAADTTALAAAVVAFQAEDPSRPQPLSSL